ncbi:hypothetical protein AMECASPLE_024787 [Ameca splendens]|uniref:Uncharacterized protein n=1 Tax=Ameca splendens TaxID=208324 RepID=A0ABV0Y4D9_9TELE
MVIPHQLQVHHSTARNIFHKWKTFKVAANLPRSKPYTLPASVSKLNFKVHKRIIRKKTKAVWVVARKKLLSKKNMATQLRFVSLCLKHKTSGTMSFGERRPQ